jgi:hypothetical protein
MNNPFFTLASAVILVLQFLTSGRRGKHTWTGAGSH